MLTAASLPGSHGSLGPWPGRARLGLVCLVAFSASLPMAWISLSKLILFIVGLFVLLVQTRSANSTRMRVPVQTTVLILVALSLFAVSLSWTAADFETGLLALVKHAKLLEIVLLVVLVRSWQEARVALLFFLVGQTLLVVLSWLLVAGMAIPYLGKSLDPGVVFSSYLDQGIMLAVSASVLWYLRGHLKIPSWLAFLVALAALANVLLVLRGRTGYIVAFAMLVTALSWRIPQKFRLLALVALPMTLGLVLFQSSNLIRDRVSIVASEVTAYSHNPETVSSSGWRLNSWTRSVSAISEQPLFGHGVGGWTATVKRLQGPSAMKVFGTGSASNPHQEYLLWGVELGIGGIALLIALLISLVHEFKTFSTSIYQAGLSAVVALAIACLFNSSLYDGLIGDYFCVLLGLLMAFGRHQPDGANNV